jgi:hypothetical protein
MLIQRADSACGLAREAKGERIYLQQKAAPRRNSIKKPHRGRGSSIRRRRSSITNGFG